MSPVRINGYRTSIADEMREEHSRRVLGAVRAGAAPVLGDSNVLSPRTCEAHLENPRLVTPAAAAASFSASRIFLDNRRQ